MFSDFPPRLRIFINLAIISGFCVLMVVFRLRLIAYHFEHIETFEAFKFAQGTSATMLFLIWNLALAWVSYTIALLLPRLALHFKSRQWVVGIVLFVWLLFLPNAPYLITDLLHIKQRLGVPMWYDVVMFFGFAFTGLMLCFASLYEVHIFLARRLGALSGWTLMMAAITLCSYGIYLGRFERWNSWDIFLQPQSLLPGMLASLLSPGPTMLGVVVVMSIFLTVGYVQFFALAAARTYGLRRSNGGS